MFFYVNCPRAGEKKQLKEEYKYVPAKGTPFREISLVTTEGLISLYVCPICGTINYGESLQ